jgi:hypothetical protein
MDRAVKAARKLGLAADAAASKGDHLAADRLAQRGLEVLSDYYSQRPTPDMNDDTGSHLTLAWAADRKGDARLAASIKQHVLAERLEIYAHFHRPHC